MSFTRTLFVLSLLLLPLDASLAQHKHDHKPKHGGVIKETGGFVYELKVAPKEITVWVTDESNKPVPTVGSTAKVTLIPDAALRAEVPLEPAGDNRFRATGDFAIKPGSSALLDVAVGGKQVAKLRYVLK
jgi:nitrogen fixation protein FixH